MNKFILCILMGYSSLAISSQVYVSDKMFVSLRTNPGEGAKVIRTIPSGTILKVLVQDDGNGYAKVKDQGNNIGWIRSRFLIEEPTAAIKLKAMKKELNKLNNSKDPIQTQLRDLRQELAKVKEEKGKLASENKFLKKELDDIKKVSSDAVAINEKKKSLEKDNTDLSSRVENLSKDNLLLKNNSQNEGIKLGIAAVGLGLLIGLFLPYIKPRRRLSGKRGIRLPNR